MTLASTPMRNSAPKPPPPVVFATPATHLCAPDPRLPIAAFVMPLDIMRSM